MKPLGIVVSLFLFLRPLLGGLQYQVIQSTPERLHLRIQVEAFAEDDLKPVHFLIGLPTNDFPDLQVNAQEKRPLPEGIPSVQGQGVRWIQKQRLRGLNVATLEIDPREAKTAYYRTLDIILHFPYIPSDLRQANKRQTRFLAHRILNWSVARSWIQPFPRKRSTRQQLPTGTWLKIQIQSDGVFVLYGGELLNLLNNPTTTDPRTIHMYTGPRFGREQTHILTGGTINYSSIPDNLVEVPLWIEGEADSSLDASDRLYFYGRGATGFNTQGTQVVYKNNIYFIYNTYWLLIPDDTSLRGKRIRTWNGTVANPVLLNYGQVYIHTENDLINPFDQGNAWVGPAIRAGTSFTFEQTISDLLQGGTVTAKLGLQGGSTNIEDKKYPHHHINVYLGSTQNPVLDTLDWSGLRKFNSTFTIPASNIQPGSNLFILANQTNDSYSQPYFDYLTLQYARELTTHQLPFEFWAPLHSNAAKFTITGSTRPQVWMVTDPSRIYAMSLEPVNDGFAFSIQLPPDTSARFMVFDTSQASPVPNISLYGRYTFASLRNEDPGVEHLIIGPEEFRSASQPLVQHRGSSRYVSLEDIYNQFTGGNTDPIAIRWFLQWTQEYWSSPQPDFVLLMGDADYDYRNLTGDSQNRVPTIEIGEYNSRATDDRLAGINGTIPELALGRFPAQSISEVEAFVSKTIAYETEPLYGLWRQRVTLVADDAARPEPKYGSIATGKSHTRNSENLADLVSPLVELQKLYMMEFPEVSDASSYGVIKPDATQALFDLLKEGTGIINYIGHGSAHQWAQEKLLYQDRGDVNTIDTGMKLPIWIAGTCSWGHFDNIGNESFAEELIRRPMNGAVGIITTSRPITVSGNAFFEEELFRALFPNRDIATDPVGIIHQSIKDGSVSGELFHYFGDPATPLPIPYQKVNITSITPDTLLTLDTARFAGNQTLDPISTGSGIVTLRDADRTVTRYYNIASMTQQLTYNLPGATLFKGQFSFVGEQFIGSIRIPLDISYSDEPAQLNVYLTLNTDPTMEALGLLENIPLRGGAPTLDQTGPIITFETADKRPLRSGDHLNIEEPFIIRLSDPLGINITGEVGHEILLTDLNTGEKKNITNKFVYDLNKIDTGTIPYELDPNTSEIALKIKAWDSANNPAEKEIRLSILTTPKLRLYQVMNYPNPFATSTQFTFEITSSATVTIDIYTLGGRRIKSLGSYTFSAGFHTIPWDGRDAYGNRLANGTYLYRLKAKNENQSVATIGKLAKFR